MNGDLLRGLLKDSWGFDGFTVSDYASLGEVVNHRCAVDRKDAARQGVMAGLDMEMSTGCYADFLVELVRDGSVPEKFVDDAVRRVLEQKYRLGLFEDPFRYCNEERERTVIGSAKSREDALYVAERSIVLLENENNFLPLSPDIRKVALVGPLSKSRYDMCGMWSCADQSRVVTLYDAMMERGVDVLYSDGYDLGTGELKDTSLTMSYARQADAVVVTIGERAENSGEMRCRGDISIAQEQQALVSMLAASGKPVVVLLMCGRPVIFNEAREAAASVLCTWWLGSESGNAIHCGGQVPRDGSLRAARRHLPHHVHREADGLHLPHLHLGGGLLQHRRLPLHAHHRQERRRGNAPQPGSQRPPDSARVPLRRQDDIRHGSRHWRSPWPAALLAAARIRLRVTGRERGYLHHQRLSRERSLYRRTPYFPHGHRRGMALRLVSRAVSQQAVAGMKYPPNGSQYTLLIYRQIRRIDACTLKLSLPKCRDAFLRLGKQDC